MQRKNTQQASKRKQKNLLQRRVKYHVPVFRYCVCSGEDATAAVDLQVPGTWTADLGLGPFFY